MHIGLNDIQLKKEHLRYISTEISASSGMSILTTTYSATTFGMRTVRCEIVMSTVSGISFSNRVLSCRMTHRAWHRAHGKGAKENLSQKQVFSRSFSPVSRVPMS